MPGITRRQPLPASPGVSSPRATQTLTNSGRAKCQYRTSWCQPVSLLNRGCFVITQLWCASGTTGRPPSNCASRFRTGPPVSRLQKTGDRAKAFFNRRTVSPPARSARAGAPG